MRPRETGVTREGKSVQKITPVRILLPSSTVPAFKYERGYFTLRHVILECFSNTTEVSRELFTNFPASPRLLYFGSRLRTDRVLKIQNGRRKIGFSVRAPCGD